LVHNSLRCFATGNGIVCFGSLNPWGDPLRSRTSARFTRKPKKSRKEGPSGFVVKSSQAMPEPRVEMEGLAAENPQNGPLCSFELTGPRLFHIERNHNHPLADHFFIFRPRTESSARRRCELIAAASTPPVRLARLRRFVPEPSAQRREGTANVDERSVLSGV